MRLLGVFSVCRDLERDQISSGIAPTPVHCVVLDLQHVPSVDASAVGAFMDIAEAFCRRGVQLVLVRESRRHLRDLLDWSGLGRRLTEHAMASSGAARGQGGGPMLGNMGYQSTGASRRTSVASIGERRAMYSCIDPPSSLFTHAHSHPTPSFSGSDRSASALPAAPGMGIVIFTSLSDAVARWSRWKPPRGKRQ